VGQKGFIDDHLESPEMARSPEPRQTEGGSNVKFGRDAAVT